MNGKNTFSASQNLQHKRANTWLHSRCWANASKKWWQYRQHGHNFRKPTIVFTTDFKTNSLLLLSSSSPVLCFLGLACEGDFLGFTRVSLTATRPKEGADAPGPQKMWVPLFSMTRLHKGCAGMRCLPWLSQLLHLLLNWLACMLGQHWQAEQQKAAKD